jgi:hypothetical protein
MGMPEISDWQPIETVPRDVPVLLSVGKLVVAAAVDRELLAGHLWIRGHGFDGYEWEWDFTERDITHWMPLPSPYIKTE